MVWLFWFSLGLLAYTYAGYFLVLLVLAPVVRRLRRPHPLHQHSADLPTVTLIISVHNEAKLIEQRIDNFEALDYPPEKLELMLGDDCSEDTTRDLIRERVRRNPRIRLFEFPHHPGKTEVINQLVPQAAGAIIAFSDANTFYEPDALRLMTRHYADPDVGSVCGRLILRSPTGVNTDDRYWQYETLIKRYENDLGVVLGANGGIYSLRKELFRPLKSDVIQIDDFIWPVRVYEFGRRGVYEPAAVAHEEASPYVEAEFRRKVRIGTGDYRALRDLWRLLLPWKGWVAFAFWSHKVIRWCAPFLLILLFVANWQLAVTDGASPLYRWLFLGQSTFYLGAMAGWFVSRQQHLAAKLLRIPYYFTGSNLALLLGFFRFVTGKQKAVWKKEHRAN